MLNKKLFAAVLSMTTLNAWAHHGVAGLGTAGLIGPGAPVESSTATPLPQGKVFLYAKVDYSAYKRTDSNAPEATYSQFDMLGAGYGFKPWLSGYVFLPYHIKAESSGGTSSEGFADVSWMVQLGLKWDDGLRLQPKKESLDDWEDWHFTLYGGSTLPTGDPNHRLSDGSIDPGKSTGYGNPAYMVGATLTKWWGGRWTLNMETSYMMFQSYTYATGDKYQFGNEFRLNIAPVYRLWSDGARKMRLDAAVEAQWLALERDELNGVGEAATGGRILYITPGVRLYYDNVSLALGLKMPSWTDLNESDLQQGAEGKEDYRVLFSASYLY